MADQDPVDLEAVKQGQRLMWSQGDFAVIATTQQIVGENLCEAVDVFPGDPGVRRGVRQRERRDRGGGSPR